MPLRRHRLKSLFARLVLLSLAAVALAVLRPARRATAQVQEVRARRRRSGVRRVAVSLTFATLFFAGAAFSAGAGEMLVQLVEEQATAPAAVEASDAECDPSRRSDWDPGEVAECAATAAQPEAAAETPASAAPAEAPAPEAPPTDPPAAGTPAAPETASPETASPATAAAIAAAAGSVAAADEAATPAAPAKSDGLRDAVASQARATGGANGRSRPRAEEDSAPPVVAPQQTLSRAAATPDPEVDLPGMASTVWLHRALPDPTPPSRRLTKSFARNLRYASRRHRVDWALMLGVLRARGDRGSVPATKRGLNRLGRNLVRLGARRDQWNAVLALEGRTAFADRTIALARYHRAVGLNALVRGLEWARPRLARKLLADMRVSIYPGGRNDIASGKTDVRVIVLIQYMAECHGQVTVSSLTSGHRIYSRPGVVSAHTYGQAVDIAALEGKSILGNSAPGGLTEKAVRNMLLLPAELRPNQLISLLGLGGPSFPMGNHDDHIHAGF